MSHYYETDNNLKSNINVIDYTFRGNVIKYYTDNGIFSKQRVDFGTNILLNNLPIFNDNSSVLDVGCGYGTIGLAVAKSNKTLCISMVDVNLRALELCNKNIKLNNITNAKCFESNAYENVSEEFDYIITNPPIRAGKSVVHNICLMGNNYLKKGGKIYIVIQKKQGAESLIKAMNEVYNVNVLAKESGYFIIEGCKK